MRGKRVAHFAGRRRRRFFSSEDRKDSLFYNGRKLFKLFQNFREDRP
jgi:hypothetical protein